MVEQGIVYKSTGSNYKVKVNGNFIDCTLAGKYRLEGVKSTNPVAVGDQVLLHNGVIDDIVARRNYIIRQSTNLSKRTHIIASNLDRVMLVVSISKPEQSVKKFPVSCRLRRFILY